MLNRAIVVMGPSACGKTTLARLLADSLQRPFVEGDELHPRENRERMARGHALTDADRAPFLDAVGAALAESPAPVASCSALKRAYRDRLRERVPDLLFILPLVEAGELLRRVTCRDDHFMPASLLDDQLATLEPLTEDEDGLTVDGSLPAVVQVRRVLEQWPSLR